MITIIVFTETNMLYNVCYLSAIQISRWAGHSTTFAALSQWKLRHFTTPNLTRIRYCSFTNTLDFCFYSVKKNTTTNKILR